MSLPLLAWRRGLLVGAVGVLCQGERASLGVAADRPHLARMYHRSAVGAHALERGDQIVHRKIGQRERIAGPAPADVHTNRGRTRVRLPALALSVAARLQLKAQHARPEPPSALGVVGGKLDQGSTSERQERPQPYPAVPPQGGCAHGLSGARGTPGCPPRAVLVPSDSDLSGCRDSRIRSPRGASQPRARAYPPRPGAMADCRGVLAAQAVQPRACVLARCRLHHSAWRLHGDAVSARALRTLDRSARGRFRPDLRPRRTSTQPRARCTGRRGRR